MIMLIWKGVTEMILFDKGSLFETERGLVYVIGRASREEAIEKGFSYSFSTSRTEVCDLYSRCIDVNHREFLIVQ